MVLQTDNILTEQELNTLTDWKVLPLYLLDDPNSKDETYSKNMPVSFGHCVVERWKDVGKPFGINSTYYNTIVPILNRFCEAKGLEYRNIYRIAINVTLPSEDEYIADPHVDHMFEHHLALIYLNDSAGDTVLFEGDFLPDKHGAEKEQIIKHLSIKERITPKEGKMVVVPKGLTYHTAYPCHQGYRAVIVITFGEG